MDQLVGLLDVAVDVVDSEGLATLYAADALHCGFGGTAAECDGAYALALHDLDEEGAG